MRASPGRHPGVKRVAEGEVVVDVDRAVVVAEITGGLVVHAARDAARCGEALLDLQLFLFQFSVFIGDAQKAFQEM
jgi:hypothetical protein